MSATVKLSSKLPGDDETNGLDPWARELVKGPDDVRLAIVWFDVSKVTVETDSHAEIPTVRIRRIEPVDGTRAGQAAKLAEKAFAARTGRQMLPLDELEQPTLDE